MTVPEFKSVWLIVSEVWQGVGNVKTCSRQVAKWQNHKNKAKAVGEILILLISSHMKPAVPF